jgi:esterase/lipase superfamily enzyme
MAYDLDANKVVSRWRSERMQREITLVRWGHFGQPVLLFPTAGGDAEEVERMHLVAALAPLLEAGRLKVYACDSAAGRALLNREGHARHQMWLQNQFHHYVRREVVPAIHADCKSDALPIWATGASIGAFHAAAVVCRFPDVFSRAYAMSGTYDLRRFFECSPHDFTDDYRVSSPLDFVPTLGGHHLDVLRSRYVLIVSGSGRAEDTGESWRLGNTLGRAGIPNHVDIWGPEWHHDWPTWRVMLPRQLTEWTNESPETGGDDP